MNIAIWILQGILAVMFIMVGMMKSTQSKEKIVASLPSLKEFNIGTIRLIGIAELLGAIGLIVPYFTGVLPVLTAIAALGLALIMVLAAVYHFRKKEFKGIAFNSILFILSLTIAYYRF